MGKSSGGSNGNRTTLPSYLCPKLRIFFSLDIVGSTAYKQGASISKLRPGKSGGEELDVKKNVSDIHPAWFRAVSEFYRVSQQLMRDSWQEITEANSRYIEGLTQNGANSGRKKPVKDEGFPLGDPPGFWKAVGDEVIFTKILTHPFQVRICMHVWTGVLAKVRENLQRHHKSLNVKSSAWLAGFPVSNTEFIFRFDSKPSIENDSPFESIADLEEFSQDSADKIYDRKSGMIKDFIGPSIDSGFRIAQHATTEKMTLSIELAYLLAHVIENVGNNYFDKLSLPKQPIEFGYTAGVTLKGVLGGAPYPIFWIDIHTTGKLRKAELQLTGESNRNPKHVKEFAKAFIDLHPDYLSIPYIKGSADLGVIPPAHEERMIKLTKTYQLYLAEKVNKEGVAQDLSDSNDFGESITTLKPKIVLKLKS